MESKVGTSIKEPISVHDLPSFTCNSSDKIEHYFRTSCNKNSSFNKKAGQFRKHASSVSKFYFVCGSGTHLIKDCDFYEKQMANTTVNIGVVPAVRPQPVPTGKPKVTPVLTGKPKVKPVSTSKTEVTPVPTALFTDVDTLEDDAHEVESVSLCYEDLTLESLEAKSFVLTSEDLLLSS
uniref:Uncharacterized protein n=1 Tax=Tanacetum cinerariifolium TaxID=118510 RepID=A0A6L2L351_TANCI|nr:hypothetical protein [Tanacetum cinerariifolium]